MKSLLADRENDLCLTQSKLHVAEQYNDDAGKVYNTIDELKSENNKIQTEVTVLKKQEDELKQRLKNQSNIIDNLKRESNTKDIEVLSPVEINIDEKLETFSTSLLTKVSELVDKKISSINVGVNHSSSYAAASKPGSVSTATGSNLIPTDFRIILKETENEKLKEENEQRVRACNLIIHGVAEEVEDNESSLKTSDEIYVNNLFIALSVNGVKPKAIHRIGKQSDNKRRPIKVILNSELEKDRVMANLTNLKDKDIYKGMSISADYTINERNLLKEYSMKAKERNENLGPESKYIWRVRGTPKNGLELKKFLKQRRQVPSVQTMEPTV